MNPETTDELTQILADLSRGELSARERLLPLIYQELRALAGHFFQDKPPGHTLRPTILVHDVFMRLAGKTGMQWEGRSHFMAVAARAMRELLVDHARRKRAAKRGGGWQRISFCGIADDRDEQQLDILDLEDALQRLGETDERQARIVELRFFAGLSVQQVAQVLGVSERTVMYDWRMARAWLRAALQGDDE